MPSLQRAIIFICLASLSFQQLTTGLRCYDCTQCGATDKNTQVSTFADNAGYSCYKFVVSVLGATTVSRGATTGCQPGDGTLIGVSGSRYCCTKDLCNAGMTLSISYGLTIVMIAISMIVGAANLA